jgi:hypothetical protein
VPRPIAATQASARLGVLLLRGLVGEGDRRGDAQLLRDALGAVPADDVRDLMAEDHGDVVVRGGVGEHAGVEADLAPGHGEGVRGPVVDDGELPARRRREHAVAVVTPGGRDDLEADLADLRQPRVVRRFLHLRELAGRQRGDLGLVDEDELRPAGDGAVWQPPRAAARRSRRGRRMTGKLRPWGRHRTSPTVILAGGRVVGVRCRRTRGAPTSG